MISNYCKIFQVQISAYLDNVFDVAGLMEDSETKSAAIEKVSDLEDELSQVKEMYQKLEIDSLASLVEMENKLPDVLADFKKGNLSDDNLKRMTDLAKNVIPAYK